MDLDLRDVFDSSFDPEPPLRPLDTVVRAGRSALMRRQILTSGVVVALASVALLGATQLGNAPDADPAPAGPSGTPTTFTTPVSDQQRLTDATRVDDSWRADCGHAGQPRCGRYAAGVAPVGIDAVGELVRLDGDVQIAQRADDPTPPRGVRRLVVEVITPASIHPSWWVLTRGSAGVTAKHADPGRVDFATWARAVNHDRTVKGAPHLARARSILGG